MKKPPANLPPITDPLPSFTYHPDPFFTGAFERTEAPCDACRRLAPVIYAGPVFGDLDHQPTLCPWCIASGLAHERFGATFIDVESLDTLIPQPIADLLVERTPFINTFQQGHWPACCADACTLVGPLSIAQFRERFREFEGSLLSHIIHDLGVSGRAALNLLESLQRDQSPALILFACRSCDSKKFHIDTL